MKYIAYTFVDISNRWQSTNLSVTDKGAIWPNLL